MNKSLRRSVCYNVSCYRFLAGFGNWKLTAKLRQIPNLLSGWASCPDTCSLVKHHWINPGSTISISRCFKARTVFVSKVRNNKTFLKAWLKHIFIGGKKKHMGNICNFFCFHKPGGDMINWYIIVNIAAKNAVMARHFGSLFGKVEDWSRSDKPSLSLAPEWNRRNATVGQTLDMMATRPDKMPAGQWSRHLWTREKTGCLWCF